MGARTEARSPRRGCLRLSPVPSVTRVSSMAVMGDWRVFKPERNGRPVYHRPQIRQLLRLQALQRWRADADVCWRIICSRRRGGHSLGVDEGERGHGHPDEKRNGERLLAAGAPGGIALLVWGRGVLGQNDEERRLGRSTISRGIGVCLRARAMDHLRNHLAPIILPQNFRH